MADFKVETKNKVDIDKKPRVYFTCHPDDFDKYFKRICDDIFKTHDCAIYYTEDMTKTIAEDEKTVDLGRNNLFVVPVTYKLLSTSNRAMDEDIPYALKEHIPVLPIMMELVDDELYSSKFGEMQYLNPYSTDLTEISYEEKLKRYLESVLISDELAKRVRAAFDAYIFLSYRKKDRKYANDLMRLIHSIPECRDIAIWFDEFLTPGESFKENIEKIMDDCKLFTLLVTPHIIEKVIDKKGNERDNYVISTEIPLAQKKIEENEKQGKSEGEIVPVTADVINEAVKKVLKEKNITEFIDARSADSFKKLFLEAIIRNGIRKSEDSPEHNYLIGLAYLEGVDVEVDREQAIKLITKAADMNLFEAQKKLVQIYSLGEGSSTDYNSAIKWQTKILHYYREEIKKFESDDKSILLCFNISFVKELRTMVELLLHLKTKSPDRKKVKSLVDLHMLDYGYDGVELCNIPYNVCKDICKIYDEMIPIVMQNNIELKNLLYYINFLHVSSFLWNMNSITQSEIFSLSRNYQEIIYLSSYEKKNELLYDLLILKGNILSVYRRKDSICEYKRAINLLRDKFNLAEEKVSFDLVFCMELILNCVDSFEQKKLEYLYLLNEMASICECYPDEYEIVYANLMAKYGEFLWEQDDLSLKEEALLYLSKAIDIYEESTIVPLAHCHGAHPKGYAPLGIVLGEDDSNPRKMIFINNNNYYLGDTYINLALILCSIPKLNVQWSKYIYNGAKHIKREVGSDCEFLIFFYFLLFRVSGELYYYQMAKDLALRNQKFSSMFGINKMLTNRIIRIVVFVLKKSNKKIKKRIKNAELIYSLEYNDELFDFFLQPNDDEIIVLRKCVGIDGTSMYYYCSGSVLDEVFEIFKQNNSDNYNFV